MTTTVTKSNQQIQVTDRQDGSEYLMHLIGHHCGAHNIPERRLSPSLIKDTETFLNDRSEPATPKQLGGFLDYIAVCLNQTPPPTDTLEQYIRTFETVPYPILRDAADELIKTYKWPRYPSIADIWDKVGPHLRKVERLQDALRQIKNKPARRSEVAPHERRAVARQLKDLIKKNMSSGYPNK